MIVRAQYKPEPVCECGFTVPQASVDELNSTGIMYVDTAAGSWQQYECGHCGRRFETRALPLFYIVPNRPPCMIPTVLLDLDECPTTIEELRAAANLRG